MIVNPRRVVFEVHGRPQPAGSKRAFPVRAKGALTGRVAVTDDNPRAKSWQAEVANAAARAMLDTFAAGRGEIVVEPLTGPLGMVAIFTLRRPKGHFGSGRNAGKVKTNAPTFPLVKPDTTKLIRAVEDALTGVVWADDAQVVEQSATKIYGPREGCKVVIWTL